MVALCMQTAIFEGKPGTMSHPPKLSFLAIFMNDDQGLCNYNIYNNKAFYKRRWKRRNVFIAHVPEVKYSTRNKMQNILNSLQI